jgi:hypothetical protein
MNPHEPWLLRLLKEQLSDERSRDVKLALCGCAIPANQADLAIDLIREGIDRELVQPCAGCRQGLALVTETGTGGTKTYHVAHNGAAINHIEHVER